LIWSGHVDAIMKIILYLNFGAVPAGTIPTHWL
jgi:hypothetical protein